MTRLYSNNAETRIAAGNELSAVATTIVVEAGSVFPSPGAGENFLVTLDDGAGTYEICLCTARTGNNLTVERAQQGTAALVWPVFTTVEQRVTALEYAEFVSITDDAIALQGDLTIAGTLTVEGDVSLTSPLGVASGGTGANTLPANELLVGNGTNPITGIPPGANKVLTTETIAGPTTTYKWRAEDEGDFIERVATSAVINTALSSPNLPLSIEAGGTGKQSFADGVLKVDGTGFSTFADTSIAIIGSTKFARYRFYRDTAGTNIPLNLADIVPTGIDCYLLVKLAGAGGAGGREIGSSGTHKPNGISGGDGALSIIFKGPLQNNAGVLMNIGAGGVAPVGGTPTAGGQSSITISGVTYNAPGGAVGADVTPGVSGWGYGGSSAQGSEALRNVCYDGLTRSTYYGFVDPLFEYYRELGGQGEFYETEFNALAAGALVPAINLDYIRHKMQRPAYEAVSFRNTALTLGYGGGGRGGRGQVNAWWVSTNQSIANQAGQDGFVEIDIFF